MAAAGGEESTETYDSPLPRDPAAETAGVAGGGDEVAAMDAYIRRYRGHGQTQRLLWIAETRPSLHSVAMTQAVSKVHSAGWNVGMYRELARLAGVDPDLGWIAAVEDKVHTKLGALERDLSMNIAAQHRDNIRVCDERDPDARRGGSTPARPRILDSAAPSSPVLRPEKALTHHTNTFHPSLDGRVPLVCALAAQRAYMELGALYDDIGDRATAIKSIMRAREYASPRHFPEQMLRAFAIAVEDRNWDQASQFVQRARTVLDHATEVQRAQISAAQALDQMVHGRFSEAALEFTRTSPLLEDSFNEVLTLDDVAVYGTLCALASFSREQINTQLRENSNFVKIANRVPALLDIVDRFHSCSFGEAFRLLEALRPTLELDPFLAPLLDRLFREVRHRSIVLFFRPYVTVDMRHMAARFDTPLERLQEELTGLIASGRLDARIDSYKKILVSRHQNQRAASFDRALELADDYVRDARAILLRASVQRHDLSVRPHRRGDDDSSRATGGGGSGGGGAGSESHTMGGGGGGGRLA